MMLNVRRSERSAGSPHGNPDGDVTVAKKKVAKKAAAKKAPAKKVAKKAPAKKKTAKMAKCSCK
jgi:DNA end-binding protein Ku